MRMPAQSLLPLLGVPGSLGPCTAEQERAIAQGLLQGVLVRQLARMGGCLPVPDVGWEIGVMWVRQDWRGWWQPGLARKALCRLRLVPHLPVIQLSLHYVYPEGSSVAEAVAEARLRAEPASLSLALAAWGGVCAAGGP